MSEPWFDSASWGWLPGTALGVVGGTWGSVVGACASRGKAKGAIFASYFILLAVGVVLLAAAVTALAVGQPFGVWYTLLLPGILTALVLGPLGFVARNVYRRAEEQRMHAQDLG